VDFVIGGIFHINACFDGVFEQRDVFVVGCNKNVYVWVFCLFDARCFWRYFFENESVAIVDAKLENFDKFYNENDYAKDNIDWAKIEWNRKYKSIDYVGDSCEQR
jgi:hypothetical protein